MRRSGWLVGLFLPLLLTAGFTTSAFAVTTSTGFIYPTGTSSLGSYAGWLARYPAYFSGYYHIGKDIAAPVGNGVYAIADGQVVRRSLNGWNHDSTDNNIALGILHRISDGSYFVALYGHVHSDLNVGDNVGAGQQIGTIGPYGSAPHLHFGICPGSSLPSTNLGMMPEASWPSTNGFVDPVDWITTRTPWGDDTPNPATDLYPSGWNEYATGGPLNFQWHDNLLKNGQPCDHFEIVVHRWVNGAPTGAAVLDVSVWGTTYAWTGYEVGDYVWHVTAYNGNTKWADSTNAFFRTAVRAPTNLSPSGWLDCWTQGQIDFQWYDNNQPSHHFEVVVSRSVDGGPWNQALHVPSCTGTSYTWTDYGPGDYMWHVSAYDSHGILKDSEPAYFRVHGPWRPNALSPSDGTQYPTGKQITFQWQDRGAQEGTPSDHFEIVVQRWVNGQAGETVLHVPSTVTPYSWTGNAVGDYVWHVTAYNSTSGWARSDDAYFRAFAPAPTVTAWTPKGAAVGVGSNLTVAFSTSMVRTSVNNALTINSVKAGTFGGAFSWSGNKLTFNPTMSLKAGRTYSIVVRTSARSTAGVNLTTPFTWTFKTKPAATPALALTAAVGTSAGNGVIFPISLTADAAVGVEILSMAGRLVGTIPVRECVAGTTNLAWNGRGTYGTVSPAGAYLCRLSAFGKDGSRATALSRFVLRR